MHIKKSHQKSIDFHFDNQNEIRKAEAMCLAALMHLKRTIGWIHRFDSVNNKVLDRDNIVEFSYDLFSFEVFRLKIRIQLSNKEKDLVNLRSFHDGSIVIETSIGADSRIIAQKLEKSIESKHFGFRNEILFYTEFLKRILYKHPDRVTYAHHASNNTDKKRGIDFIIGFKPSDQENIFKIEFNLKSSNNFLEKHVKRYPAVSTFIFVPTYLGNYSRLESNFFDFLSAANKEVVHWGLKKSA